jgi:hypothetical protein
MACPWRHTEGIPGSSVVQVIGEVDPDEIYNLPGPSSVGLSFEQPVETVDRLRQRCDQHSRVPALPEVEGAVLQCIAGGYLLRRSDNATLCDRRRALYSALRGR